MLGHGSKFSRNKDAAIEALLTERNVAEAARAAGIGKQALIRWLKISECLSDAGSGQPSQTLLQGRAFG
jgi:hypothetical protein